MGRYARGARTTGGPGPKETHCETRTARRGRPRRVDADYLWGRHAITLAPLVQPDGGGSRVSWQSPDGKSWTVVPAACASRYGVRFVSVRWGLAASHARQFWSVSLDGHSWVNVPGLSKVVTKWEPDNAGSSGGGVIGSALFFSVVEMQGSQHRDLWIIEFEPSPGR